MSDRAKGRRLETVLFTDIVGSTDVATTLGDARWRELLGRHHTIVRRELKRFGGREIDTAGDGFFATFHVPIDGIRCACAASDAVRELGIEIRAGLHIGETERMGPKVAGIAVVTASRIAALAGPGEVLVSSTIEELVAGSALGLEDRGLVELKGIPRGKHVFAVTSVGGSLRDSPLDPATAEERLALIDAPALARRHRGWIGAGVAAVLVAIAATLALVPRSPPPPTVPLASLNSVIEIDPGSGKITKQGATDLSLGGANFGRLKMAVGEGALWLLAYPDLFRLDPITGAFGFSVPNVGDFALGLGAVWESAGSPGGGGGLQAIDPATGALLISSAGRGPLGATPDAIWASVHGGIDEIDPQTGRHLNHVALAGGTELFATATDVWIANSTTDTLTRMNVRSNRATSQHLAATPNRIVVGGDYVWALDLSGATLTVIDAASGRTIQVIPVPAHPTDLAYGLGAVWVPDGRNGIITRIDEGTRQVSRIQAGVPIAALAVDGQTRSLWAVVANPPPAD